MIPIYRGFLCQAEDRWEWHTDTPTMVRVLCGWLADRLESGRRLQKPEPLLEGAAPLSFFTDAKAEAETVTWGAGRKC